MYLEDYTYIQEYLQGNEGAFEILYKKYRKPLYSYLNRLIPGQSQLADDIYQQAWIKAIDNLHNYKEQGTFLAWMMRISHHLFVDYCRKEAKKKTVYSEVFYENTQTNNKSIITEEFNEAYKNALAQLNDQQREVFLLRMKEISFKQIAKIQDVSINTALGRMRYATDKLKELLRDFSGGELK